MLLFPRSEIGFLTLECNIRKKICNRSQVHRFHSYSWTAFRMRIYEKRVIFGKSNSEFGAKLAIT